MTAEAEATSVRHRVLVEAPIERAFAVFTEGFGDFKPPTHKLLAVEIAETVLEPRVGGRLYDRGVDGSECHWARILAYEPPHRIVFSWDIGPRWQVENELARLVVASGAPLASRHRRSRDSTHRRVGRSEE